ncbi:MAG: VOC family protein [Xenococcaceae cyanobacterium MO_207.B15]|nr:VOC family protein [Xenococcaceae cyanobacterium MO_207.B15]
MNLKYTSAFITIATNDVNKTVEFYHQFLGLKPEPYIPNAYAEFKLEKLRLAIFKPKASNVIEFNNSTGSGLSICLEVVDLEVAIAILTTMGYPPPGDIITASHGREIYAYDPTGNRLILHQQI